ncbi:phosphohistidine phosphatase SixA [Pelagicoccus sp. SDUM812003]|uniref:phosphohistidine phosphatase SixA n=1 Tax=Pelagicoccus sp. SDUM812003 TaxID=3041267 RepID=UPI00280D119C|nr:phosphohistidine phosphatase SixA [Pelagicoccus sp. SDUM812003]MDQ8202419.1 phosphohistidine phosphatase SixA [Pelagicoccus sp. SDUM812003]
MLQHLYLVRHAHALDDAPSDALRPLSPKGEKQCRRLVSGLSSLEPSIDCIWQSGLVRAEETARLIADGLELSHPLTQKNGLAPFDSPAGIAAQAHELSLSCMIVGHEPNLSCLASLLLSGHDGFQRVVFPKASVLCLSRLKAGPQATPWQIEWHLNHKMFK